MVIGVVLVVVCRCNGNGRCEGHAGVKGGVDGMWLR
jgi:hypothetical protein